MQTLQTQQRLSDSGILLVAFCVEKSAPWIFQYLVLRQVNDEEFISTEYSEFQWCFLRSVHATGFWLLATTETEALSTCLS